MVLLISLVVLGFCAWKILLDEFSGAAVSVPYNEQVMGVAVVSDLDFLQDKEKGVPEGNPGVYFEKTLLPYSSEMNTLYLSQNPEEKDWVGALSAKEGAYLCIPEDSYWNEKQTAISEGHAFTIILVAEETYYELSLVVSGLPVIDILTSRMEEQEKVPYEVDPDKLYFDSEDLYYGSIRVFNPGVNTPTYEITECNVRYHFKGATSASFEKKGYSISLLNAQEKNQDSSLLGMRFDNSWKLNALVTDDNRIREKTAAEIWESFDEANKVVNEAGPRMEYVELVMDNDYKGLYCLVEPVDEEKADLDGDDILYKIIGWDLVKDADIQEAVAYKWRIMSSIRIRYPEVIRDYGMTWFPIRDYINKVYYSHDGFQNIAEMVYPENIYDMTMYLMVISGNDNYFKNMYFATDVESGRDYRIRQIPWDLDYTFGNVYAYEGRNFTRFDDDITVEYVEGSFALLRQYAPESVNPLLVERWQKYREDFLSTESIQQVMIDNTEYLITSGVIERENARWPQYSMNTDINYLLDFQAARMEWLDEYFGGMAN